jgi:hypothetical protein
MCHLETSLEKKKMREEEKRRQLTSFEQML